MRTNVGVIALAALTLAACGDGGRSGGEGELGGRVRIDGSSTVFPVTEAVAEEFMLATGGDIRVTVGVSGTGGGFKRFCAGETAINNASRAIRAAERDQCEANGVDVMEIPVAYDGISLITNPDNTFARCLTVEELRQIWEPGSTVEQWSDVRTEWPDEAIDLYGPGTDSGTFDYFTEAIMGESGASRADYTASEDDNILVRGVSGDRTALGYLGFAYYEENAESLNVIGIDAGEGCVRPDRETIRTGEYSPLSRPLFLYVDRGALERPEVAEFVRFYLENASALVPEVGYIRMTDAEYEEQLRNVEQVAGATT